MDSRALERLIRARLLPGLPGMAVRGPLAFIAPIGDLLRGVHFESSGTTADLRRVRVFIQPLYLPRVTHLTFTFARVLGGEDDRVGDHWWAFPSGDEATTIDAIRHEMETIGSPWLGHVREPRDLAERAVAISGAPTDPFVREAVAYSLLLVGDTDRARAELRSLRDDIEAGDDRRPWLVAVAESASESLRLLERDPAEASRRLADLRSDALRALRLARFAA